MGGRFLNCLFQRQQSRAGVCLRRLLRVPKGTASNSQPANVAGRGRMNSRASPRNSYGAQGKNFAFARP